MPAFNQVAREYAELWDSTEIVEAKSKDVAAMARRVLAGKERYKIVEAETGVPWYVIGLIHGRESTCDFSTHLHNGDPLTRRTYSVPRNRPATGKPPFSWEYSAKDALHHDALTGIKRWTVEAICFALEKYNGWGYRGRCASPYLWSGTQHYTGGKYVRDGVFDRNEWDKQSGCIAVLKAMMAIDVSIIIPREADPVNEPRAQQPLRESRTVWGLIYIKLGSALTFLANLVGGVISDAPEIISQAETHQGIVERGAALVNVSVPYIGAACIGAGLCLALYARISAHMTGKVG